MMLVKKSVSSSAKIVPDPKSDKKAPPRKRRPSGLIHSLSSLHRSLGLDESKGELKEGGSVVSISKSLLNPNTVYQFRLVTTNSFNSSGAGILTGYINFDPSVSAEWSTLTSLFDQVRGVRNRLSIVMLDPHSDGYATGPSKYQLFVSCDQGKNSVTPASVSAVVDCPNSKMLNLGSTQTFVMEYVYPKNMNWAPTSAPATAPDIGCYGEWQYYANALAATTSYFAVMQEFFIEFRSRT